MAGANPDQSPARMGNTAAVVYIVFASVYTVIVLAGLYGLYRNRAHQAVRMRNVGLTFAAVFALHLYLVAVFAVFPIKDLFPCPGEFWIMSIFFPCGVAMFQALNMQLLSYACEQKVFLKYQTEGAELLLTRKFKARGLLRPWSSLDYLERTYLVIFIGLGIQLTTTIVLFFGSRRFHSSYGIFGEHVDAFECRRGFEWIPGVFWQFFWTFIFGPYVLYRIRHIRDAHYWALQTRLAILACLPGTPFWLAFLYSNSPVAQAINAWFLPAMWYAPGLVMMEFVSIFIPLWDVYRQKIRVYRQYNFHIAQQAKELEMRDARKSTMYTMTALDTAILRNLDPLLRWATEVDFTGENIIFLREVRNFRKKWLQREKNGRTLTPSELRERFEEAGMIYFTCVNPVTAHFPINIKDRTFKELEAAFEELEFRPHRSLSPTRNVITPWEDERPDQSTGAAPSTIPSIDNAGFRNTVDFLYRLPVTEIEVKSRASAEDKDLTTELEAPASFSFEVFDTAFMEVRYLVFTNTWTRFVEAGETASITNSEKGTDSAWPCPSTFISRRAPGEY